MNPDLFDLGRHRGDWRIWLKERLERQAKTQRDVADRIEHREGDGRSKTTAVNRFVTGDPAELRKWFEQVPAWIDIFADVVQTPAEVFRAQLQAIRLGTRADAPWHRAFPGVTLAEVEIPAPLHHPSGATAPEIAAKVGDDGMVFVRGRPGRGREIAVAQLRRAVADGVDVELLETLDTSSGRGTPVVLAPWGPAQAAQLATKLAACNAVDAGKSQALLAFAEALDRRPEMLGQVSDPTLVVELLVAVARDGCPRTVAEARARLTDAAWQRIAGSGERLARLDERLLERLFARLARRERSAQEIGTWLSVPREVVVALVGDIVGALYGSTGLDALVDAVSEATRRSRPAAIEQLRRAIAADAAEALVDELVAAGVLVVQDEGVLRPAEPVFACIWAARGLDLRIPDLDGRWERLVDPDWVALIEELARHGASYDELLSCVQAVPPELALDRAVVLVRFAVAADKPVRVDPQLVTAWADVCWAVVHSWLGQFEADRTWGGERAVKAASWRYRAHLPAFGDDPVGLVQSLVSPACALLVEAWVAVPRDLSDHERIEDTLWHLCQGQNVPDTPARARWWAGQERGTVLATEHAERGSEGCIALLSGGAIGDPDALAFWRALPVEVRLRWALSHGPQDHAALRVLQALLAEDVAPDLLLPFTDRWESDVASAFVRDALTHPLRGERARELAFRVVERRAMVDLLEHLVRTPRALLATAAVRYLESPDSPVSVRLGHGWMPVPIVFRDAFRGVHFDVAGVLKPLEDDAHRAAVILYRLGHPDPLRERWEHGGTVIPASLVEEVRRYEALLTLLDVPLGQWQAFGEPPWAALGAYGGEGLVDRPAVPSLRADAGVRQQGEGAVMPQRVRAIRGVEALLGNLPGALPRAIAAFLEQVRPVSAHLAMVEHHRWVASKRAAHALVELGHLDALRCWVRYKGRTDALRWEGFAWSAVDGLVDAADDVALSRLWDLLGSALDVANRPEREFALLVRGSVGKARKEPLPFVVEYALAAEPGEVLERLHERNEGAASWRVVLRRELGRAPDARSRCRFAVPLIRRGRNKDAVAAVRWWMLEDPHPFSGSADWTWLGNRWVGGAQALLEVVLAMDEAWVAEGVVRLLKAAAQLPIGDGWNVRASYGEAPETCTLAQSSTHAPWPLKDLAEAAEARGQVEEVLWLWRDASAPEVRAWLSPWARRHADDDELERNVLRNDRVDYAMLDALVARRPRLDLRPLARKLVEDYGNYWLLLRVDPERVPEYAARKVAEFGPEALHNVVLAPERGWEHAQVAWEVRRLLLRSASEEK